MRPNFDCQSTELGSEARCVSLQKISRCKDSIPTDKVWLGHNNTIKSENAEEREKDEKNVLEFTVTHQIAYYTSWEGKGIYIYIIYLKQISQSLYDTMYTTCSYK